MNPISKQSSGASHGTGPSGKEEQHFILDLWGVRYQVKDVERSVAFYTEPLGFKLDLKNPPAFAQVSVDKLKLMLEPAQRTS
jgi:hypothetical protein